MVAQYSAPMPLRQGGTIWMHLADTLSDRDFYALKWFRQSVSRINERQIDALGPAGFARYGGTAGWRP